MTPEQLKHLDFIQAIINRMAQNSFIIKGWSITIVSAILTITVKEKNSLYCYLGLMPLIAFWLLDSYYLLIERRYRDLYNDVIKDINSKEKIETNNVDSLSLYTGKYQQNVDDYISCMISFSVLVVYFICSIPLLVMIICCKF